LISKQVTYVIIGQVSDKINKKITSSRLPQSKIQHSFTPEQILKMIEQGESELNISITNKQIIPHLANNNIFLSQLICIFIINKSRSTHKLTETIAINLESIADIFDGHFPELYSPQSFVKILRAEINSNSDPILRDLCTVVLKRMSEDRYDFNPIHVKHLISDTSSLSSLSRDFDSFIKRSHKKMESARHDRNETKNYLRYDLQSETVYSTDPLFVFCLRFMRSQ
jgi:hypothetical protein